MILDEEECRARLASGSVARLSTVRPDGRPHLVPVTYAMEHDVIVVVVDHKPKSTTRLQRLANIAANPGVAFLVDEYTDDWSQLWWVRADATAVVVDEGEGWAAGIDQLSGKYPQYAERRPVGPLIRARVDRWSGWSAALA